MKEDPVTNAPIESLQRMLRAISFVDPNIPRVIPDGIYGASTEAAVAAFQREHGLPVASVADEPTFRAIARAYNPRTEQLIAAHAPVILFPASLVISGGQFHPYVYLAQAMFLALRQEFPSILNAAVTGTLDSNTAENFRRIQSLSGLDETGHLDKTSWNRLSDLFRVLFDRNFSPSQG